MEHKLDNNYKDLSKIQEINSELSVIEEYDVLYMPAFKLKVLNQIKEDKPGTVIMADINDLYHANKNRGKEKVNGMINEIINELKDILKANNLTNYSMGKMGDEIYIYLADKNLKEITNIMPDISKVRSEELSISVGASDNFDDSLTGALKEADMRMCENKRLYKLNKMKEICDGVLDKVIENYVKIQIDKMRINLKKLKQSNKLKFKDTYNKVIELFDANIDELVSNILKVKENTKDLNQDLKFENKVKQYELEAYEKFGPKCEKNLVKEYVLASVLSKHEVDGALNLEYFTKLGFEDTVEKIKSSDNDNSVDFLAFGLSGLKGINDKYGHEQGDIEIEQAIRYIKDMIDQNNIQTYSDIIVKRGGDSFIFVDKLTNEQKTNVNNTLLNYGNDKKTDDVKISIINTAKEIDKSGLDEENFVDTLNELMSITDDEIERKGFDSKINNITEMKLSIEKVFKQVLDDPSVAQFYSDNKEENEKLLKLIKECFKKALDAEIEKSNKNLNDTKSNQDSGLKPKLNKNEVER